jgi:origin recognition complex subunit 4
MPGYTKKPLDPKVALGKDLSLLEFCLLLAIKHIETQLGEECYNFEMIYEEYLKFYRRTEANGSRGLLFSKKVAYRAFDTLKRLEFIVPSASETLSNQCPKEYKLYRSTLVPFQIEQITHAREDLPSTLKVWGSH